MTLCTYKYAHKTAFVETYVCNAVNKEAKKLQIS